MFDIFDFRGHMAVWLAARCYVGFLFHSNSQWKLWFQKNGLSCCLAHETPISIGFFQKKQGKKVQAWVFPRANIRINKYK